MSQNSVYDVLILDARDDFDGPTAATADLNELGAGLVEQVGRDRPVNDTQNLTHRMGMGSEQVP